MKTNKCALFLFNTYADWEPALAIAGLKTYGGYQIDTFSVSGDPVTSMGGIRVLPTYQLSEIKATDYDLLILPGGEAWEQGENTQIKPLVLQFQQVNKPVAAICGATLLLAQMGLLDEVPHTSNMPGYLKQLAPAYQGEAYYQENPCVRHQLLITANGAGMVEFAHEIFMTCGILDEDTLEKVKILYKSGGIDNRLFQHSK